MSDSRAEPATRYVVVWLDHKDARVFRVNPDETEEAAVGAPLHDIHHEHPATERLKSHSDDTKRFFAEIGRILQDTEQILVVGPSTATLDFLRHVHEHQPVLEERIVGVETLSHPTDQQLVAYAKKYFGVRERGP